VEPDRPEPRATSGPEHLMAHIPTDAPSITINASLSGAPGAAALEGVLGALADTSPIALTIYLLARQIIPALLVVCMTRGATPSERVALLQAYLSGTTRRRRQRHVDGSESDAGGTAVGPQEASGG
jgi:hypothetical protein